MSHIEVTVQPEMIYWRKNRKSERPVKIKGQDFTPVLFQLRQATNPVVVGRFWHGEPKGWESLQGENYAHSEVVAWANIPNGCIW
jgi:hypothetical protein